MLVPFISSTSARAIILVAFAMVFSGARLPAEPQGTNIVGHKPVILKRVGDLAFDPPHPSPVSYEDDSISLRLNFNQPELGIIVQKKGEPQHEIALPSEMVQVDEVLRAPANHALVIGWANGDLSALAVLDTRTTSVSDFFLGYMPTPSPDGKYLAFIKFYPPHGYDDKTGPEDHYMLYDLTRAAPLNRPVRIAASNPYVVGTTVYPPNIGNRDGDNMAIDNGDEHFSAMQEFFWSPDSDRIVFADKYKKALVLVMVHISGPGGHPVAATVEIPEAELCARTFMKACDLQLAKAEFDAKPSEGVTVSFFAAGLDQSRRTRSLHFVDNQFKLAN
jgi:hypothetical protein